MDKNKITVQAALDTSQLKKDLDKLKGTVDVRANTKLLERQIEAAVKNAAKNSSITLSCGINGMDSVTQQIGNAVAQLQNLKQTAYSLPSDLTLNLSVNSQGLQQYTAQLERLAQLSSRIQMPAINTSAIQLEASIPKTDTSFTSNTATNFKEATSEGNKFSNTLSTVASSASLLTATFNMPNAFKGFTKNLD